MKCSYCGDPFVPEGRRQVCATCGAPPPVEFVLPTKPTKRHSLATSTSEVCMEPNWWSLMKTG